MPEMAKNDDFRVMLREELATRCQQNPRYSLRAFARDLKLAPSRLSEIINGKQGLSRDGADKVAALLGYGSDERDKFCDLVASLHARSHKDREAARIRLRRNTGDAKTHKLKLDAFRVIADWYHLGILELLNVKGARSDVKWLARKLKISETEAELATDRLERIGLLKRNRGRLIPTYDDGAIQGGVPSESIKKFHRQILARATEALFLQPVEERDYQAQILSIDRAKMAEAKKAIDDFQHNFCRRMDEAEVKDGLYCLAIQFFNLADGG